MVRLLARVVLLATLVAIGGPADAGGVKIIIGGATVQPAPHYRHLKPGVGPHPIVVWPAPVYVVRPQRCQVPGYWAYAWVPQSYASHVWVDGRYSSDALWIEGHWEPRVYTGGYYQPYWVPERWTDC